MMDRKKAEWILYTIIAQSFLGVVGSLYLSTYGDPVVNGMAGNIFPSEAGLPPCEFCWYGRIFFYPLLPIALVGYIKSDKNVADYLLPLSIPGIFLTFYHYGMQKFGWGGIESCNSLVPCNDIQVEYFGFLTIPLLACLGFVVITVLAIWYKKIQKSKS